MFFYFYIVRGLSLIFMLAIGTIGLFGWRLVKPCASQEDWVSDEVAKKLYVALYVGLNQFVQYMRTTILAKNGMKDVAVSTPYSCLRKLLPSYM